MCKGWVKPWANSNIIVIGELRSISDKEISVPNRACVCLLFNIAWYGNSIDLDLYSAVRVVDIFCCGFVTSIHSASYARNIFEIWSFYWSAVFLVNKICIEGLFSYISKSRFPSINHSNDIATTNKVMQSVNGCLEVKYANISMINNDNFKRLPLLYLVLVAVHSRTMVKLKQLVYFFFLSC